MDKLKNLINPGKTENDQTLYGSGQTAGGTTTGNTSGLTGEGSHFGGAHETTGTSNTSGLTGNQTNSTGLGNTQNTGASSGTSSGLTGNQTTGTGLGNTQNTGISSGTTTAGPHSSNLANKADPTVDSDLSGSRTTGQSGLTGNTTANPSSTHHVGRDAAAVGTAGAVGEGVHHHRENEHGLSSNTQGTPTNNSGLTSHHTGTTGATGATGPGVSGPHSTDTANRLDPSVNTQGSRIEDAHHHSATHGGGAEAADKHHTGRDAGIAAGGAGLAEHEHHKHQNENRAGVDSTGIGHSTSDNHGTTATSSGQHVGRDAAIGAGGVGLAEHEHHRHEGSATSLPGPAPNTAGPHKQDWLNKLDPRVNANPETSTTGTGPFKADAADYPPGTSKPYDPTTGYTANPAHHGVTSVNPDGSTTRTANPAHHGGTRNDHLGRDAAIAGGVGGAGYEAEKHHHSKNDSGVAGVGPSTGNTTATGPHSSNLAHTTDADRSKDHHYGKDAAVAGGVGGAAYEADKHHKHDKDLTAAEREQKREHKHELKEEKREHKESKGGLLSFLHRDKNKKYTPEEEAEFDRQEREHNSHKGRDALGGAAVGTGAYEAEKHHGHHTPGTHDNELNKPFPTAPGNQGVGTGAGTQNALAGDNTTSGHSHLGRDAAVVGGAGAVGEHEHHKHSEQHGTLPLDEKPRGTDIGDKLHGVERNCGVNGASGFPGSDGFGTGTTTHSGVGHQTSGVTGTGNQSHLGRDAAVGAGGVGLAEHEHRKHEGVSGTHHGNTGLTGSGNQYDNTTSGSGSHAGRDTAALGAAGTIGEREHRKHEGVSGTHHNTTSSGLTGNGNQYNTASGSGTTGSHIGRDSAALGTAGVGEHEYRKHDTATGHQSGLTGHGFSTGQSGTTGSSGLTGNNTTGEDRNRLHKEPPIGHPASGVPASGAERERTIGQGENRLDGDTGVANSHVEGGVNAASNY